MCHNPHRTENVHLLRKPGSGVCLQCHTSVTMAGLDTHATDRCSDCVRCHDPHASDREHLLRAGVTGP